MSTKSNEDLFRLERALLVQMSARKYYSDITELDEQQAQHLRKIDSTICKLKGKRDEIATTESIGGRSSVPSAVPKFLHDWISQDTDRQSEQRTSFSKRSFLNLEDPEPSTKKRNIFLVVAVLLLIAIGAAVMPNQPHPRFRLRTPKIPRNQHQRQLLKILWKMAILAKMHALDQQQIVYLNCPIQLLPGDWPRPICTMKLILLVITHFPQTL
jgi:hypothetical protein